MLSNNGVTGLVSLEINDCLCTGVVDAGVVGAGVVGAGVVGAGVFCAGVVDAVVFCICVFATFGAINCLLVLLFVVVLGLGLTFGSFVIVLGLGLTFDSFDLSELSSSLFEPLLEDNYDILSS
jgi:hypothetical protein